MKALTSELVCIGPIILSGCGPRDPPKRWLEAKGDSAQLCNLWRSCMRDLFFFIVS